MKPYLFVFEDYPDLEIPKTTNVLDGKFADLKNKLRNYNGLSKARKMKFIDGFFRHNTANAVKKFTYCKTILNYTIIGQTFP